MNIKKGWYRVLIVISVLWTNFAVILFVFEYDDLENKMIISLAWASVMACLWGGTKVIEWIIKGFTDSAQDEESSDQHD